ncbi:AmmeMemoRadiSam system radical SAM enzyme [Patescibacteria group bacterium]|nr:AmmeMemoRadiSam system radical SAM enzyme [Patescibacteria group bacterium]
MPKICHKKLWEKLEGNKARCKTCSHYCLIHEGRRGICGVRENKKGKLYSMVYGKAIAVNIDPIEKKPFFHFLPGTKSLSIATVGCNFRCNNCQNWSISQAPKIGKKEITGEDWPPSKVVKMAMDNKCPSISYTYTEPTIFIEYALDTMKLAKNYKLKNIWVSNGYMSAECIEVISPYLDAANIDLKSFSDKFYRTNCGGTLAPVLEALKLLKKKNIWVEITTLVIPGLSDDMKMLEKIAKFIYRDLGAETPWHVSQFMPAYKLPHLEMTPAEAIKRICEMGHKVGLKYVYAGNIPGTYLEDTYCSKCRQLMIDRELYSVMRFDKAGKCANCGENLNLIL